MISAKVFRELALSFPETTEAPHFDRAAFKVKKIFATLDSTGRRAHLKMQPADQAAFCAVDETIIYPLPNKWGTQGWTVIELSNVKKAILLDALTCAYIATAPPKLAAPFIAARGRLS